jgi:hypothetical protein
MKLARRISAATGLYPKEAVTLRADVRRWALAWIVSHTVTPNTNRELKWCVESCEAMLVQGYKHGTQLGCIAH